MGYTTWFNGSLTFNKEITEELKTFINNFSSIRHMKRDNDKIKECFPNWKNLCYKGNLGTNGEYFIGGTGFMGQDKDTSILDYNCPSRNQPGLWCQWIINDEGELEWDGGEKFYEYEAWLFYLIDNFFAPEGYIVNGTINFEGEDPEDFGEIIVEDNEILINYGIRAMSLSDINDTDLINELRSRGYKVS